MNQRGEQNSQITSELESMRMPRLVYWAAFILGVGFAIGTVGGMDINVEAYPYWWVGALGLAALFGVTSGFVAWFLWGPLSALGEGLRWIWSKMFPPG